MFNPASLQISATVRSEYVSAYFSLENAWEIKGWQGEFKDITSRSYMRGYRDIYGEVSRFQKLMIRFCDSFVKMVIVKISFR